ncbi:MAG: DUF502 domain-containing protein [Candidatus Omnitrophota bacterium]|nr:MAG: DUF502 domain-containing protein [Candidatus Omnitrophota bacterium]
MLNKIRNNFLTGVAIIFPLAITVIIVRYLVIKINSWILNPLVKSINVNPYLTHYSVFIAKFLAFLIVIFLISFVGWAASVIFLRRLFSLGEKVFLKIPMVGKIYSVTKEMGSAFLGQKKAFFKRVVLIEYPRKGLYSIAFITRERQNRIKTATGRELIGVFVATTPNPTSGIFLLVPKEEIKFLDMTVEEGLKLVVSSGTIMP